MKIMWACLLLLICGCSTVALAQGTPVQATGTDDLQLILEQQRELQQSLASGDSMGLKPRQILVVQRAQKDIFALSEGKTAIDQLSMEDKLRLENALERINAEIVNTRVASDDQNVCWRERTTGSSLKATRCGTVAEMREAREGARGFLQRPRVCRGDCGAQP